MEEFLLLNENLISEFIIQDFNTIFLDMVIICISLIFILFFVNQVFSFINKIN